MVLVVALGAGASGSRSVGVGRLPHTAAPAMQDKQHYRQTDTLLGVPKANRIKAKAGRSWSGLLWFWFVVEMILVC